MDFALETLTPALQAELGPIIAAHKDEIAHYQDIPLDPDWESYYAIQGAGALRPFTLRDAAGELQGYAVFFVRPNGHYRSSLQAVQDILYLAPRWRGRMIGFRFIKWCDAQLRVEGVQAVYQHCKASRDLGPLLKRLGYELVDLVYAKRLDLKTEMGVE